MKTRPILFKAPMVRAILAGRKRVTRRLVKASRPTDTRIEMFKDPAWRAAPATYQPGWCLEHPNMCGVSIGACPYGYPGDGLYVKETWQHGDSPERHTVYRATDEEYLPLGFKWRASIYMPREASRITLRVTDVRVERLQAITEEDAKAEGVEVETGLLPEQRLPRFFGDQEAVLRDVQYRFPYSVLWDSINGPGAWDANPWVWRVGFERVTP